MVRAASSRSSPGNFQYSRVQQLGQPGGDLLGDAVRVGPGGHRAGHDIDPRTGVRQCPETGEPGTDRPGDAMSASARQVTVLVMT